MLECLDGDLEQQTLLGIDAIGFSRRDAEEVGVELVDTAQERAPLGGGR